MDESKELKGKVSRLVNENKVLNDQLKDMKEETSSLSSQLDYLERNPKGKNVEVSGVHFEKNENVVDLDVKIMTNVDPQLSEEDIYSARRLMKTTKIMLQSMVLFWLDSKTLVKETTYLKIKRILMKLNSTQKMLMSKKFNVKFKVNEFTI